MSEQQNKVEAILYAAGKKLPINEIVRLCKLKEDETLAALQELSQHYSTRDSALMIVNEGPFWKISIKEPYIPLIRSIVSETELDKGTLETLAVIAFRYPILQSDVIKLRTNKAYEHMTVLEESGYITRVNHGRSKLIKLTDKFFQYFDLEKEDLKDRFKDFESIARAIEDKETELEKQKAAFHEKKKIARDERKKAIKDKLSGKTGQEASQEAPADSASQTSEQPIDNSGQDTPKSEQPEDTSSS